MKSLYRRYRPLKLADVVGQEQVTKPLISALKQGKISHAYLLIGPRGCGKTSVARILAHAVNGFKYELEDNYVDIVEIDGASNRGIDNIRELREKVAIAPTIGKYKVYIIDEVHMLTKEAFNALLKTLEEPPAHAIFIMATTDAYKVPVTITSRAQTYTFTLTDTEQMFEYLKTICQKEKIDIADDALLLIAKKGGGSFRDSLSLLDQISTLSQEKITKEMVVKAMGLPLDEKITELFDAYKQGDMNQITSTLKELLVSGVRPETLVEEMINTIIAQPEPALLPLLKTLPDVRAPYAEAKLLVALSESLMVAPTISSTKVTTTTISTKNPLTKTETKVEQVATEHHETNVSFDWGNFTNKVQELSDAVYSQLIKTEHELIGDVLHIYPGKRIVKTILSRDNNKGILLEALGSGVKITIHDPEDSPSSAKKDKTLDQISAIMGGEVINDGGNSPF